MKIHLMSDLHTESHPDILFAGAGQREDVLCLVAGDWANGRTLLNAGFNKVTNPNNVPIVAVHGNHDWYGLNRHHHGKPLRIAAEQSGVTILDRDIYEWGEWTILGCTLWTNFSLYGAAMSEHYASNARAGINDFYRIQVGRRALSTYDVSDMYDEDCAWLDRQLSTRNPERTIVMTHFGPHPNSVHPIYQQDYDKRLNPYFCNDSGLIEKHQPLLWVHGHTHQRLDYRVGKTQVLCNPRGYDGEFQETPFDSNLIIDLSSGEPEVKGNELPSNPDPVWLRHQYPRVYSLMALAEVDGRVVVPVGSVIDLVVKARLQDPFSMSVSSWQKPVGGWWPMDIEKFLAEFVSADGDWYRRYD